MADPIEIPAHVLQPMIEECIQNMHETYVFKLGGRDNRVDMGVNFTGGIPALRRIDALPGGIRVNSLGDFIALPYPPPHQATKREARALYADVPTRHFATMLANGLDQDLAPYRSHCYLLIAYLFHAPEPYLEGWSRNLTSGEIQPVGVTVLGQMDWE